MIAALIERRKRLRELLDESLFSPLADITYRRIPYYSPNSIAWLSWHMARCEDVGINRLSIDSEQVLDHGGWQDLLKIPHRHIGTEMTADEVAKLSVQVDVRSLLAYHRSVLDRTDDVLGGMQDSALDEALDPEYVFEVLAGEGVLKESAQWVAGIYQGKTRGWFQLHSGLTHNFYHVSQVRTLRAVFALEAKAARNGN